MSNPDRKVGVIVYAEDGDEALLEDFAAYMSGPEGTGTLQIVEGVPLSADAPSALRCAISLTGVVLSSLVKAMEVYMFRKKCIIKVGNTTIDVEYMNAAEVERVLDKAAAVTLLLSRRSPDPATEEVYDDKKRNS